MHSCKTSVWKHTNAHASLHHVVLSLCVLSCKADEANTEVTRERDAVTLRTEVDLQAQKLRQSGKEWGSAASYNIKHTKRTAHKEGGGVYFTTAESKWCF